MKLVVMSIHVRELGRISLSYPKLTLIIGSMFSAIPKHEGYSPIEMRNPDTTPVSPGCELFVLKGSSCIIHAASVGSCFHHSTFQLPRLGIKPSFETEGYKEYSLAYRKTEAHRINGF